MTGQKSKFKELDEGVTGQVKFGVGSTVHIKGKGCIVLQCKNGEERLLSKVYYIPTLRSNIISLGQLSEAGNEVVLRGDYLRGNRLYKIIIEGSKSKCMLSKSNESSWVWHSRLGHVNFRAMNLMSVTKMVYGMPITKQPKETCTGCLMSKQTRNSFPSQSNYCAKKVLELIHADLCGPIMPATPAGNKYFFLLVDDFSRVMWVYMLKSKDEAFDAFRKFRAQIEDGPEKKIKTLRTDRGGEFMSKQFLSYCEEAGIYRQFTAPFSPQQNGVVERRNRTVVEMARSFLKEKRMPAMFWGEAVRHSVYILNKLPTRAVFGVTPYEAWSGNKPHIGHIRVFGCIAHMKTPTAYTKKLDDRSKPVIHLGKKPGTKAYRVYDPVSNFVHVSRDLVFEETKSWAWEQHEKVQTTLCEKFVVENIFETDATEHLDEEGSHTPQTVNTGAEDDLTDNIDTSQFSAMNSDSDSNSEPKNYR